MPRAEKAKARSTTEGVALQNYVLLATAPTGWLLKDNLGISANEIRQTRQISNKIPIGDDHAEMDESCRVVVVAQPSKVMYLLKY